MSFKHLWRRLNFFLILLIGISIFLCYKNYTPGTILSGWDTIHPEFNLGQYWQRITSVWQGHQGLGAPPSQAHASEIPRMLIYSLLFFIFSLNFVRYSYIFLMIVLGPIGVFLFLKYILSREKNNTLVVDISAFLGALFYLLNLGTVQHFIVILEMFATNFGFLGFIFLYSTKFLDKSSKKNLLIFSLFIILSSAMAHTATLWYVFYLGLVLYLITYSLFEKINKKTLLKKSLLLISLTLVLNLYWIMPNVYYSLNYGVEVTTSKIHRLFSEEAYLNNKDYGKFSDLLLFKNFLFNWNVYDNPKNINAPSPLMGSWIQHLKTPTVPAIGYLIALSAIIGAVVAFKKRKKALIALLPITLVACLFLLCDEPGISIFFDAARNLSPIFKEMFRFPFTKFSIYLIFAASVFFSYFNQTVLDGVATFIKERNKFKFFLTYFYTWLFLILFLALPAFEGNFLSKIIRVKIPREYYALFQWSQKADSGRILALPLNSIYGWTYYNWDLGKENQIYQGAGFLWFGLKNPLINREFDRWYQPNEQCYREFSYALYSQNAILFEQLLDKYQIEYLLLDENVDSPGGEADKHKLFYPETEKILSQITAVKEEKKFGDKITIYRNTAFKSLPLVKNYQTVAPAFKLNYLDQVFIDQGNYISGNSLIYPARNILKDDERINKQMISFSAYSYKLNMSSLLQGISKTNFTANFMLNEKEFYTDVFLKKEGGKKIIVLKYLLPYLGSEKGIQEEILLPDQNSTKLVLNNKLLDIPQNASLQEEFLGEAIVSSEKTNEIILFNENGERSVGVSIDSIYPFLCSDPSENQIFGGDFNPGGISLYGLHSRICAELEASQVLKTEADGLYTINLNYQIPVKTQANLCILDKISNQCLIQKTLDNSGSDEISFYLKQKQSKDISLKFLFDTSKSDELATFEVQIVKASFLPEKNKIPFVKVIPSYALEGNIMQINGNLPFGQKNVDLRTIPANNEDCGAGESESIEKKFVDQDNYVEYKAKNGAICENFDFSNLSQQTGYILALESQNISGLPLRLCFEENNSRMCILDDELTKNKGFDTDYFIIPPYGQKGGYHLILRNTSIGENISVNRLKSLRIIPFPYLSFESIYLKKSQQENNLGRLIVLDQAYEKNWKAYLGMPFLGPELKHVSVNNWANGFLIEKDEDLSKVIIIFLPQYLEYLGFALLVVAFFCILKTRIYD